MRAYPAYESHKSKLLDTWTTSLIVNCVLRMQLQLTRDDTLFAARLTPSVKSQHACQ